MGGSESLGVWDGQVHTAIFKMHKEQGPRVQDRKLSSLLGEARMGGDLEGEWIHVYVRLSLCAPPETITTLLIDYTPI